MITIKKLSESLLNSWGKDTAQGGNWDESTPSLNQCAVTALVVQDYLGGDLMRQKLNDGDSHYWNRLPDGQEIDLSFEQFRRTKQYGVGDVVIREREYTLSFPDTVKRYEILKDRVDRYLEISENGIPVS